MSDDRKPPLDCDVCDDCGAIAKTRRYGRIKAYGRL